MLADTATAKFAYSKHKLKGGTDFLLLKSTREIVEGTKLLQAGSAVSKFF